MLLNFINFLKLINKNAKNILYFMYIDFVQIFRNLKKILKKKIYIFNFLIILILIQIPIFIFILLYFIFFIYYFVKYIFNFVFLNNHDVNIDKPFCYNYYVNDNFYKNKIILHILYYLYYYPSMKAFHSVYFIFKSFSEKNNNSTLLLFFIFMLIFIPIRLFIKIITGFSYISIKLSSQIMENYIDIIETYKFENWSAVLDNILLDMNNDYYYNIKNLVLKHKIYFKDGLIIFNPWYDKFFKDVDILKKSLFYANNLFKIRFVETKNILAHPIFISKLNFKDSKELTMICQSSNKIRLVISEKGLLTNDTAVVSVDKGVLGKLGVHDFRPVTVDILENEIKISNITEWKVNEVEFQKKIALKALYIGFYKKDLVMKYGKIVEGVNYNYYINRLFDLHEKKELTKEANDAMSYMLDFAQKNIKDDIEKIAAWEFLFKYCIITETGEVFFPNFKESELPPFIQNMLEN